MSIRCSMRKTTTRKITELINFSQFFQVRNFSRSCWWIRISSWSSTCSCGPFGVVAITAWTTSAAAFSCWRIRWTSWTRVWVTWWRCSFASYSWWVRVVTATIWSTWWYRAHRRVARSLRFISFQRILFGLKRMHIEKQAQNGI